jgi:hypothetical protein
MWKVVTTSRVGKNSNSGVARPNTGSLALQEMVVRALAYFRMVPGTGERETLNPILSEGPTTPPHE